MAEASAKMHLREYVRTDDVDLAISVAIGSFVSAQKLSVKRSLERVGVFFVFVMLGVCLMGTDLSTGYVHRGSASIYLLRRITTSCSRSYLGS